jgi:hypothetical protein
MLKIALFAPALLLIPLSGALAQAGGSYRGSCSNISQDGSMLTAQCRGAGGQTFTTSIDTARCGGGGIANTNGRLTCGGVAGSASRSRGGEDFGQGGDAYQGRRHTRGQQYESSDQNDGYDMARRRRHRSYENSDQGSGYSNDEGSDRSYGDPND